jgi:hypothetical protein
MTPGFAGARLLVLLLGALCLIAGLAMLAFAGIGLTVLGIWAVVVGIALIVGALIERVRYRSEIADREGAPAGPGGGEPLDAPLEPRFQRTDEVFVDPTSGRRMRVWMDPRSGERRYRAEDRPMDRTA